MYDYSAKNSFCHIFIVPLETEELEALWCTIFVCCPDFHFIRSFIHTCTGLKYVVFFMLVNSHIFLLDFFYKLQALSFSFSRKIHIPSMYFWVHATDVSCCWFEDRGMSVFGWSPCQCSLLQSLGGQHSARFLTCGENTDLLQGNRQHSKSYKGCHWEQFV